MAADPAESFSRAATKKRRDGEIIWTVTYLEGGEFWETDEHATWREAMDDFIRRMGLDHEVTICGPLTSDDGGTG